ncbi:MAG: NUDIX domain-containing protein [Beutenbergiaceae bacterium]
MPERVRIEDAPAQFPVLEHRTLGQGRLFDLVSDTVDLGAGGVVQRDYLQHPGAVAVVALDEAERVLLIRQYRHPARTYLWEIPAGLLDIPGEVLVEAAARELAEEADLTASRWHTLVDFYTSPGNSDEALRIFLARDVAPVPSAQTFQRTAEELEIIAEWVPLTDAVALVHQGSIHNPSAVVGILAAHSARAGQWRQLRAADAPWVR